MKLSGEKVTDVDNAVERRHDLMAKTGRQLLWKHPLQPAFLGLEDGSNVVDHKDLPEYVPTHYATNLNFKDLFFSCRRDPFWLVAIKSGFGLVDTKVALEIDVAFG